MYRLKSAGTLSPSSGRVDRKVTVRESGIQLGSQSSPSQKLSRVKGPVSSSLIQMSMPDSVSMRMATLDPSGERAQPRFPAPAAKLQSGSMIEAVPVRSTHTSSVPTVPAPSQYASVPWKLTVKRGTPLPVTKTPSTNGTAAPVSLMGPSS